VGERARRDAALQTLDSRTTYDESQSRVPAYEASQPPALLLAHRIVLRVMRNTTPCRPGVDGPYPDFRDRLHFHSYRLSPRSQDFQSEPQALGITALIALMPGLTIDPRSSLERRSRNPCRHRPAARVWSLDRTTIHLLARSHRWCDSRSGHMDQSLLSYGCAAVLFLFLWLIWRNRRVTGKAKMYAVQAAVCLCCPALGGWW
jgi:hypothetical protein